MKKLLPILFFATTAQIAFAQDSCETAMTVTEGTYTVESVSGTEIPMPICSSGGEGATAGMWYAYTPSETLFLNVTTDLPETGNTDTRVQVYIGACGDLVCIAGDDDGGTGLTSMLSFQANEGNTYYIAFDNRYSSGGFNFQLTETPMGSVTFGFTPVGISNISSTVCVVDMNGDFLDDVVSTSSTSIRIHYQQPDGSFTTANYTTASVPAASWSIAAGDIDGNGFNDLLYGNGQAVSFVYANEDGTAYTATSFSQYVFSQRSNFIDINNDGNLDAFVCHDVAPNVFFINDGGGNLSFNQGGLGDTPNGGNYGSIWVDYDNDCDMDMFIAKCGADNINQMHRNNGDGTFSFVAPELDLDDNASNWSSAWGDFDNDGDMDGFIGASGGAHIVRRNNGDGSFSNVTAGSGFDIMTSTSIEWITHDFNNDGYLDIMGGGNVVMFGNGDLTFTPTAVQISNGAVGDLNNDGFLDIMQSGNIYYNNANNNNYIKINTVGTVSNKNGIGARVEITSALGTQIREVRSGDGFRYMSSLNTHFGIGSDTEIEKILICWPSGLVSEILNPEINTTVTVVEEATSVGIFKPTAVDLLVYPNPATDVLYLGSSQLINRQNATVFDISGKVVLESALINDQLNVSDLNSGVYFLRVVLENGEILNQKFIKQ
jgi:hypothetical protein